MAREMPSPKPISGAIDFMPSDGFFLAARDIMKWVPLPVRIADVVTYPKGTPIGGHAAKAPFPAVLLETRSRSKGEWVAGKKPWAPNVTALWALYNRFGQQREWWIGQIITLNLTPRRSPKGAGIVAGIYVVPTEDERTEEQVAAKMAKALRGECPYAQESAPEREPGADEGEPPPADDFDQRTDTDNTEPPADWQPGDTP